MDNSGRITGTLVKGPDYYVIDNYSDNKDDPANCYNQAIIHEQYKLVSIFEYQHFAKYDKGNDGPLPGAKFEVYSDAACTSKVNVKGLTLAEDGYVQSDKDGIVTVKGNALLAGIVLGKLVCLLDE